MSQNSDCPVNKSVVLSFDAKEGQQSTFPLEANLDVLISSMLKGINDEYTKPISVVPAGSTKYTPAPFVKLNTPDAVIIPPSAVVAVPPPAVVAVPPPAAIPPPISPESPIGIQGGAVAVLEQPSGILPGVPTPENTGEILSGVPSPAPFNPTPIAPPAALVTPNQPAENIMSPTPLAVPSPTVKVERFTNNDKKTERSIERAQLISKIIGILFLVLIAYLVLVKLQVVRYY